MTTTARPLPQTDYPLHVARLYVQLALAAWERGAYALARGRLEKASRWLDEAIAAGGR